MRGLVKESAGFGARGYGRHDAMGTVYYPTCWTKCQPDMKVIARGRPLPGASGDLVQ